MQLIFKGGGACPEQYDVFDEDSDTPEKQVAYVRLRWGHLRVVCPDICVEPNTEVYYHDFNEEYKGIFCNDTERDFYLKQIRKAINKHYALQAET